MKMNCKFLIVLGCLFVHLNLSGQVDNYEYQATLDNTKEGWNSIILPLEVYSHVKPDFSDIRVYGKREGKNKMIEQPYIIESLEPKIESKGIKFNTINETRTGNTDSYTFELAKMEMVNKIIVDFGNKNFDWKLKLEGSNDLKSWSTIGSDYRIISFENSRASFKYNSIDFPESKFQFYRISFDTNEKSKLTNAYIKKYSQTDQEFKSFAIPAINRIEDETKKTTIIEADLGMKLPLRTLNMTCTSQNEYFRRIKVDGVVDSFKTEKGWNYSYSILSNGMISSEYGNKIELKTKGFYQKLKITIYNFDDQPLPLENFEVQYPDFKLTSRFDDSEEFTLCYGNQKASKPKYDITYFQENIPETTNALKAGNITFNPKEEKESFTLFKSKWWLWAIMLLIILILGTFTLKMVKDKN